MKFPLPILFVPLLALGCQAFEEPKKSPVNYPATEKKDIIDNYFGEEVQDPFRWLEDDNSEATKGWVTLQNETTQAYLENIPFRKNLKDRLRELWNYEKITAPFKEGEYTYFYKNDGLQNQYVLYRFKEGEEAQIFLDPNRFSEDGTTSLMGTSFTEDGELLAYTISEGGSDWRKIIVIETQNLTIKEDTIKDVKFSNISWYKNEGFYYSSYDKPLGSELSDKTDQHKLYYHRLGTNQSEDELIFGGTPNEKHRYVTAKVTKDNNYLLISAANSTAGNKLFLKNLVEKNSSLIPIISNEESDTYLIDNRGANLFLVTNYMAPNQKIVQVTASSPTPENWIDIIPETEHVLNPTKGGGFFFAEYMVDANSKVLQYNFEGTYIRDIQLPGIGSTSGFSGKKEDKEVYFNFTNYYTPGSSYKFNVNSGHYEQYWSPQIDFDPQLYESKQVFYPSKDGTKIPMTITYKKGLDLNAKNPTILYGYGGFNVSLTPNFSIVNAIWLEQGGVYAVPNLRGGGEYGKKWHDSGIKFKKQNVFDDFIAAAEYLIKHKYTSNRYLAIKGGSNGGLLVGATLTQRPDLMQVALPAVGVLDMLRYHTFTSGAGWHYDYGTSEDSAEMFAYLKAYSPLHNIKNGVIYPATLITTGDHDDRVVPAHSFKFAAELQDKQFGDKPVLIRIETNAGHGAGTPVTKTIEQYADIFGFTFYNMGYKELPNKKVNKTFKE